MAYKKSFSSFGSFSKDKDLYPNTTQDNIDDVENNLKIEYDYDVNDPNKNDSWFMKGVSTVLKGANDFLNTPFVQNTTKILNYVPTMVPTYVDPALHYDSPENQGKSYFENVTRNINNLNDSTWNFSKPMDERVVQTDWTKMTSNAKISTMKMEFRKMQDVKATQRRIDEYEKQLKYMEEHNSGSEEYKQTIKNALETAKSELPTGEKYKQYQKQIESNSLTPEQQAEANIYGFAGESIMPVGVDKVPKVLGVGSKLLTGTGKTVSGIEKLATKSKLADEAVRDLYKIVEKTAPDELMKIFPDLTPDKISDLIEESKYYSRAFKEDKGIKLFGNKITDEKLRAIGDANPVSKYINEVIARVRNLKPIDALAQGLDTTKTFAGNKLLSETARAGRDTARANPLSFMTTQQTVRNLSKRNYTMAKDFFTQATKIKQLATGLDNADMQKITNLMEDATNFDLSNETLKTSVYGFKKMSSQPTIEGTTTFSDFQRISQELDNTLKLYRTLEEAQDVLKTIEDVKGVIDDILSKQNQVYSEYTKYVPELNIKSPQEFTDLINNSIHKTDTEIATMLRDSYQFDKTTADKVALKVRGIVDSAYQSLDDYSRSVLVGRSTKPKMKLVETQSAQQIVDNDLMLDEIMEKPQHPISTPMQQLKNKVKEPNMVNNDVKNQQLLEEIHQDSKQLNVDTIDTKKIRDDLIEKAVEQLKQSKSNYKTLPKYNIASDNGVFELTSNEKGNFHIEEKGNTLFVYPSEKISIPQMKEIYSKYFDMDNVNIDNVNPAVFNKNSLSGKFELMSKGNFDKITDEPANTFLDLTGSQKKSPYFSKDQEKAKYATKYIGEGSYNSSTQSYANTLQNKANVGDYTKDDIVFISAEGNRTGRISPNFDEIQKAIDSNARFITDNIADRTRQYNIGEREVAEYLTKQGYVGRDVLTKDGQHIGLWEKQKNPTSSTKQEVPNNVQNILNKVQTNLANKDYKALSTSDSHIVRKQYIENILTENNPKYIEMAKYNKSLKPAKLNGDEATLITKEGTKIANKYNRIVVGDYGAYYEINPSDIIKDNIIVKNGEEYRIKDPNYKDKVKYEWYTTKDNSDVKIYRQKRKVSYADYKPGMVYVSVDEVSPYGKKSLNGLHIDTLYGQEAVKHYNDVNKSIRHMNGNELTHEINRQLIKLGVDDKMIVRGQSMEEMKSLAMFLNSPFFMDYVKALKENPTEAYKNIADFMYQKNIVANEQLANTNIKTLSMIYKYLSDKVKPGTNIAGLIKKYIDDPKYLKSGDPYIAKLLGMGNIKDTIKNSTEFKTALNISGTKVKPHLFNPNKPLIEQILKQELGNETYDAQKYAKRATQLSALDNKQLSDILYDTQTSTKNNSLSKLEEKRSKFAQDTEAVRFQQDMGIIDDTRVAPKQQTNDTLTPQQKSKIIDTFDSMSGAKPTDKEIKRLFEVGATPSANKYFKDKYNLDINQIVDDAKNTSLYNDGFSKDYGITSGEDVEMNKFNINGTNVYSPYDYTGKTTPTEVSQSMRKIITFENENFGTNEMQKFLSFFDIYLDDAQVDDAIKAFISGNKIGVTGSAKNKMEFIEKILPHEVAHKFGSDTGLLNKTNIWKNAINADESHVLNPSGLTLERMKKYVEEDFAVSMQRFISNPYDFATKYPERAKVLDNTFKNFKAKDQYHFINGKSYKVNRPEMAQQPPISHIEETIAMRQENARNVYADVNERLQNGGITLQDAIQRKKDVDDMLEQGYNGKLFYDAFKEIHPDKEPHILVEEMMDTKRAILSDKAKEQIMAEFGEEKGQNVIDFMQEMKDGLTQMATEEGIEPIKAYFPHIYNDIKALGNKPKKIANILEHKFNTAPLESFMKKVMYEAKTNGIAVSPEYDEMLSLVYNYKQKYNTELSLQNITKMLIDNKSIGEEVGNEFLSYLGTWSKTVNVNGHKFKRILEMPIEEVNKLFGKDGRKFFIDNALDAYLIRLSNNKTTVMANDIVNNIESIGGKYFTKDNITDVVSPGQNMFVKAEDLSNMFNDLAVKRSPKDAEKMLNDLGMDMDVVKEIIRGENYVPFIKVDAKVYQNIVGVSPGVRGVALDEYLARKLNAIGVADYREKVSVAEQIIRKTYDKILQLWKINATAVKPGFHVRNAYNNLFQSYLNVGAKVFDPEINSLSFKLSSPKQFPKDSEGDIIKLGNQEYSLGQLRDMVNEYGFADKGQIVVEGLTPVEPPAQQLAKQLIGDMKNKDGKFDMRTLNPLDSQNFAPYKIGRNVGNRIENQARISLFLANIANGEKPWKAAHNVDKFLFDYSDLSDFEKQWLKRLVPFYSWLRKNTPLQLEMMMKNPKPYQVTMNAIDKMDKSIDKKDYIKKDDRNEFARDWVQTPIKATDEEGTTRNVFWNPNLPYGDLQKVTSPSGMVSAISPVIKTPFELAMNRDFFYGNDIAREPGATKDAPGYMQIGADKENPRQISAKLRYALRTIPSLEGIGALLSKSSKKNADSQLSQKDLSILSQIFGITGTTFDNETFTKYRDRDKLQKLKQIEKRLNNEATKKKR